MRISFVQISGSCLHGLSFNMHRWEGEELYPVEFQPSRFGHSNLLTWYRGDSCDFPACRSWFSRLLVGWRVVGPTGRCGIWYWRDSRIPHTIVCPLIKRVGIQSLPRERPVGRDYRGYPWHGRDYRADWNLSRIRFPPKDFGNVLGPGCWSASAANEARGFWFYCWNFIACLFEYM